jgi:hypothetical protein
LIVVLFNRRSSSFSDYYHSCWYDRLFLPGLIKD